MPLSPLRGPIHAQWIRTTTCTPWQIHYGLQSSIGARRVLIRSRQWRSYEKGLGLQSVIPKTYFSTENDVHRSTISQLIRDANFLAKSLQSKDADAWAKLLDRILPRRLQPSDALDRDDDELPQYLHVQHSITIILARAKAAAKVDLLAHLGVRQEKWEVVDWVVDVMLQKLHHPKRGHIPFRQPPAPIWPSQEQSLDNITQRPICVQLWERIGFSLDDLYDWETDKCECHNDSIERCCLAHIWQALGCMIIQAEDRSKET